MGTGWNRLKGIPNPRPIFASSNSHTLLEIEVHKPNTLVRSMLAGLDLIKTFIIVGRHLQVVKYWQWATGPRNTYTYSITEVGGKQKEDTAASVRGG